MAEKVFFYKSCIVLIFCKLGFGFHLRQTSQYSGVKVQPTTLKWALWHKHERNRKRGWGWAVFGRKAVFLTPHFFLKLPNLSRLTDCYEVSHQYCSDLDSPATATESSSRCINKAVTGREEMCGSGRDVTATASSIVRSSDTVSTLIVRHTLSAFVWDWLHTRSNLT